MNELRFERRVEIERLGSFHVSNKKHSFVFTQSLNTSHFCFFLTEYSSSFLINEMTQENQPKYDSKWQYWSMVIMIYSCLVAMGVVENARSVTFPLMKSYFDISYDTYGFFSSSISIAYIVFCLLASFVSLI